jgi:hypothetical protein
MYVTLEPMTTDQLRARWAEVIRSVPNVRRLVIDVGLTDLPLVLSLLPSHLPRLESLALGAWNFPLDASGALNDIVMAVAHPNLRQLEFGLIGVSAPSDEQMRACVHSARLPKLERCVFRKDCSKMV